MDILKMIYDELIQDQEITDHAAGKIKYYEFPESLEISDGVYIIIDPLDVPTPSDFADDLYLKYDVMISIETWSKNRTLTRTISEKIESIMWEFGLVLTSGIDEFDEKIYRNVKRYRGKLYRDEIIKK